MYRVFNIEGLSFENERSLREHGEESRDRSARQVRTKLDQFLLDDATLDGKAVMKSWFPLVESDVFMSHSHADEALALSLVGWLEKELGLQAFVDSAVWGHPADLLRQIDDKYCLQANGRT